MHEYSFIFYRKVDSTMNEIKKDKYRHYNNVAIISKKQTDGRGRRKKSGFQKLETFIYQ